MHATTTAPTATCICGNCPAIRLARGLVPFCQIDTTAPSRLPVDKGFASYSEAAAARYLLRSCNHDFTAHGGYRWPSEVGAECRPERWDPRPVCGDGLHGFLRGEGDAGLADWSERAQWLVFSADEVTVIDQQKAKAAHARIEHVGQGATGQERLRDCLAFMARAGQLGSMAMGVVREGGDGSTLTGGDGSTLTGGDGSTLTGGYGSTLTGGDGSTLTGGNRSTLTGGNRSTLTGGDGSTLTGGNGSTLTGGYGSTLTGGNRSTLTGGNRSTLTGGDGSTLTGGDGSTLTGGYGCTLIFRWYDYAANRWRLATADTDFLKPETAYTVKDGKIVEVQK